MIWALVAVVLVVIIVALLPISAMLFTSTSQWFGRFPYQIRTKEKLLALSFDDGPNPPYTDELLNVLRNHGVKATFFVVGKNLEKFPQLGRTMVNDGHCIGNHTYSHEFSTYFSRSKFTSEIERAQAVIADITGTTPTLFRPPWLFRLPWTMHVLKTLNLTPISAVFGYEFEVIHQRTDAMVKRALQKVKPGLILDFHDGYDAKGGYRKSTVETIDKIIPALKSQGYTFLTVPELLQRAR